MRKTYETKRCPRCTTNVQLFFFFHFHFFFFFYFTRYSLLLLLLCPPLMNRHSSADGMHKGLPVQVTAGIRGSLPEEGVFRLRRRIPALIPNVPSHNTRTTRGNVPGFVTTLLRLASSVSARVSPGHSWERRSEPKCSDPRRVRTIIRDARFSHREVIIAQPLAERCKVMTAPLATAHASSNSVEITDAVSRDPTSRPVIGLDARASCELHCDFRFHISFTRVAFQLMVV